MALLNDEASASDNQPEDEEDEQPGQGILTLLIVEMPVENDTQMGLEPCVHRFTSRSFFPQALPSARFFNATSIL